MQAARDLAARREERRRTELQVYQQETEEEDVYKRATEVSPGFNYLGIGYDAIKGNPLGDPNLMGDPGLRSPIIRFYFQPDAEGVSSDLSELQPRGAYSRPFVACKQSENLTEVATISDYVKELETDAALAGGDAVGLNSFSASAAYTELAKKAVKKKTRTFLLKTYCLRYEAGLAQTDSFNWNYTMAFDDAVDGLPEVFDGSNNTGCTPTLWRENTHDSLCNSTNVRRWMDFIDQFGTHYIVRLFAGGKLTHQITMSNSDIAKMNSSGVNIKSALKATFGVGGAAGSASVARDSEQKEQMKRFNYETETLIMGGRVPSDVSDPDSMADWSDSVEELPMPVKITLQPLGNLLPDKKKEGFEKAYRFYAEAIGMSKSDISALGGGKAQSVGEALRSGTQMMYAGDPPGYIMCPLHERIMLGFALQLNFYEINGIKKRAAMKSCAPGRDKCDGLERPAEEGDDARIYALCGSEPIAGLEQVVAQNAMRAVAVCPEGSVILSGFGLSLTGGRAGAAQTLLVPCRAGLNSCTALGPMGTEQNLVWIACVDEKTPGLQLIVNEGTNVNAIATNNLEQDGQVSVECPSPLGIALGETAAGFVMEIHTRFNKVRDRFRECTDNEVKCSQTGKGISEAFFYRKKDTHSLLAYITCAEVSNALDKTTTAEQKEIT
ncbi:uncharacterized protein LOC34622212 [Cyclospora cayetanensis]|uniref:Uncharacterized protein LOC34622212 n=1 Tax=Cyclospora cayetanensis TaxID=88456 RepID=A0A6P6RUL2_9EIME|nr:uncharacterized protein LOC34622212 [Cyclospora cayetanensis]